MIPDNDGAFQEQDAPVAVYEQQSGEPSKHYEWFHVFLLMGPSRSFLGAYKKFYEASPNVSKRLNISPHWRKASQKWNWRGRAGVWDKEQRRKREIEVDAMKREAFTDLVKLGRKLLKSSEQMDGFPLIQTVTETQAGTMMVLPSKWDRNTISRTANAARDLLKVAFEIEDGRAKASSFTGDEQLALESLLLLQSLGYTVSPPAGDEIPQLTPYERREQENLRLSLLGAQVAQQMQSGDPRAIGQSLRISQRIARLNGLDRQAPKEIETPPPRQDWSHLLDNLNDLEKDLLEALLAKAQGEDS